MAETVETIDVLLVEDDPDQVKLFQVMAKKCSVPTRIHVAGTGFEAMQFLWGTEETGASTRPRLVVLDLNLPELDGRELLTEMKAHPGIATIPVVVVSSSEEKKDVMQAYDLQARGYLKKPVSWQDLDAILKQVVSGAKGWS